MKHPSHAHPLPDGRGDSPSEPFVRRDASCTISSPTPASQSPNNDSPSQQARRLQLRKNGFRGPILPFRRISPLLGASANGIEPCTRAANNENSPSSTEKRAIVGEDLPPSPVNILQELQKISTRKKRASPRPGVGAIFEDNKGKEDASGTSWYNGGSSDSSPVPPTITPARMTHLREISQNRSTPPLVGSPLVKHVKTRNMNRGKLRSASSEAAQYIEHLESELASANAKLDLQPSPKSSKLRAAKLRTLITENRNLKQENSEWQKNFDARVQEERTKRLDADMELRTGMRLLEDEMDLKSARMVELQWELESMRVRMRELEGLEAINHNLEKRIEALTNLLVQSPTKLELSSASTSPVRTDPAKRTSRPRSMLPRVPPSPGGLRSSLTTVSESTYGRSQSLGGLVNNVESPEEGSKRELITQDLQSPIGTESSASPESIRQSGSHNRRSMVSTLHRSTPSSAKKRTSMRSTCSFAPIAWGLPDHEHSPATRQRRMRRFPSGSNSLKPLILPMANDVTSTPASACAFPPTNTPPRQDISDMSLDASAIFLSPTESSPTPELPGLSRSASWVQEETLKALEGRSNKSNDLNGNASQKSESPLEEAEQRSMKLRDVSNGSQRRLSRPRSLQKELEDAGIILENDTRAMSGHFGTNENAILPSSKDRVAVSVDPAASEPQPVVANRPTLRRARDTDTTPRPKLNLICDSQPPPKTVSSTALSHDHAHGIFFRLTNVIGSTKQDPCILARRLLANAWSQGCKRFGGIGWWLIGLVHRTRWHKWTRKADIGTAEDGSTLSDSDQQHFSSQPSRSHVVNHHSRAYGATHTYGQKKTCLSPPRMSQIAPPSKPTLDAREEPHLFPCDDCKEPSSRRTIRLWLRFSLSIILAVGIAVKHGPGTLLPDDAEDRKVPSLARERERKALLGDQHRKKHTGAFDRHSDQQSQFSKDSRDSGYGSIMSAETPGPAYLGV